MTIRVRSWNNYEQRVVWSITKFSNQYGCLRFNDDINFNAYNDLVNKCIKDGKIPEANRKEYSTHGCLGAAIIYEDNRCKFCSWSKVDFIRSWESVVKNNGINHGGWICTVCCYWICNNGLSSI